MTQLEKKVRYTARVHITGGRDGGGSRSDDAGDIQRSALRIELIRHQARPLALPNWSTLSGAERRH